MIYEHIPYKVEFHVSVYFEPFSFILKCPQMYNKAYILSLKYPVSDYILSFYDNCQVSFFKKKILKLLNSMYVRNVHFTWAKRWWLQIKNNGILCMCCFLPDISTHLVSYNNYECDNN